MSDLTPFPGLEKFAFEAPLYLPYTRPIGDVAVPQIDGYCPSCKRNGIFNVIQKPDPKVRWDRPAWTTLTLRCVRNDKHQIHIAVLIDDSGVQKYGQHPSPASIAQAGTKEYRKYLSDQDAKELHKAIGLASHDVGIGSFVYMRRVWERIMRERFDKHKNENGWTEEDWKKRKMGELIELMQQYLPEFMVENKKLYSILSLGIHQLEEDRCLQFFPTALSTLMLILKDDDRKQAELADKNELKKAIASFKT